MLSKALKRRVNIIERTVRPMTLKLECSLGKGFQKVCNIG